MPIIQSLYIMLFLTGEKNNPALQDNSEFNLPKGKNFYVVPLS